MRIIKTAILTAGLIFFLISLSEAEHVEVRRLHNGATVISRHLPSSEVTVIEISILSGLSNEGEYMGSGISHFVEHLIFKGTEEISGEDVFDAIRQIGGIINGFTGQDSAGYHITVPNENFEEGFEILVSLVTEMVFDDEDFEKEREVILREMKLHRDNPSRLLSERLFSEAYLEHAYKHPVIGYEGSFKKLTSDDIRSYHERTYAPERIVIGVAGGLPPERVLSVAEKKMDGYSRGRVWSPAMSAEPPQVMKRSVEFENNVDLGYLAIGFHSTDMFSEDMYSLDVLSILLGGGRDSRLYERLVREKELLYSVSASNASLRYPGLFVISGSGEPENMEKAEQEIFALIEELKGQTLRSEELSRAKNMVSAGFVRARQSTRSMASSIARSQLFTGSPHFHEQYVKNVDSVYSSQVGSVLKRYLKPDGATVVKMFPNGFLKKQPSADLKKKEKSDRVDVRSLSNGMKVILKKRPELPLVAFDLAFPGGLIAEEADQNGISNLTARLMLKGTKNLKENQIVPALERMGGSINAYSGKSVMGLTMDVLSADVEEGLEVFAEVVKNADFPEKELDKLKKKIIASIRERKKRIVPEGISRMRELLYQEHPYHMDPRGETDTVAFIEKRDVEHFYRSRIKPGGAVLSVVGDFDKEKIMSLLNEKFGDFTGNAEELKEKEVLPLGGIKKDALSLEKEQTLLLIGFQGVDPKDPRKYALSVLSSMLSGGGGMLFREVREERGLAYTSGASSVTSPEKGFFMVYVMTNEQYLSEAREVTKDLLKRIKEGDFSDEELSAGKSRVMTSFATSLESNSALAKNLSNNEITGLGHDYHSFYPEKIRQVDRRDVLKAVEDIVRLDEYVEVVVHPPRAE